MTPPRPDERHFECEACGAVWKEVTTLYEPRSGHKTCPNCQSQNTVSLPVSPSMKPMCQCLDCQNLWLPTPLPVEK